jgi:predicted DNA-binding ribbon-helix-helix protein
VDRFRQISPLCSRATDAHEGDYGRLAAKVVAADYHVQDPENGWMARSGGSKDQSPIAVFSLPVEDGWLAQAQINGANRVARAQNQQEWEKTMCRVFAGQDPEGYRQINRSIRIDGHSTSIQLEATFWALLDEIAESQGLTTPKFISTLYDEAIQINGQIPNFASMLRTTCALYLRGHRPDVEEAAKQKAA